MDLRNTIRERRCEMPADHGLCRALAGLKKKYAGVATPSVHPVGGRCCVIFQRGCLATGSIAERGRLTPSSPPSVRPVFPAIGNLCQSTDSKDANWIQLATDKKLAKSLSVRFSLAVPRWVTAGYIASQRSKSRFGFTLPVPLAGYRARRHSPASMVKIRFSERLNLGLPAILLIS